MECIQKEVSIHNMVQSDQCVRLHSSIKTGTKIYMIQDYCNGYDLAVLLRLRKRLTQPETSHIMRQIVQGCRDIWSLRIIHRDIKLANILLHFPENPEICTMTRQEKQDFLRTFDFTK